MADVGDLVLVHMEDKPAFFARIEEIEPDVKPQWYQVRLLVLQVPLFQVTWILRREYIDGVSFTMGGRKVVIERVEAPEATTDAGHPAAGEQQSKPKDPKSGKVITLFPRK